MQDENLEEIYAVVVRPTTIVGVTKYINTNRPYKIVESEDHTRKLLSQQYPDGWIVIGPKSFLLHYNFGLIDDGETSDFKNPLTPTGTPPLKVVFDVDVMKAVAECSTNIEAEDAILVKCPESESAKFIHRIYHEIHTNGLAGMSGVNFDLGGLPVDVLVGKAQYHGTSIESVALELNYMLDIINSPSLKPYSDY